MGKQRMTSGALRLLGVVVVGLVGAVLAPNSDPAPNVDTSTIRRPVSYGKPNQSRIWYNRAADRWDALVPRNDEVNNRSGGVSASDHYLMTDIVGDRAFTTVELEDRDWARPDAFWDEGAGTLHVLSSHPDDVEFWRLRHDRIDDRYVIEVGTPGAGVVVPGMTHPARRLGGDSPATVHVAPNGSVWAAVMAGDGLLVQHSSDGGASWLLQPVVVDDGAGRGVTTWIDIETDDGIAVGLFAGENGRRSVDTDFLFWRIAQDADPTVAGNWVDERDRIPQSFGVEQSDDHVSAAADADGNRYFAVKTEGGDPNDPLIKLYRRDRTGNWSQYEVTATSDVPEQSRPSIVIDTQREAISIYVNGAEVAGNNERVAGRFTAPLDAPERLAEAPFVPLFAEAGVIFTDLITPRWPVTGDQGVVVLAHNRTDRTVWFSTDDPEQGALPLTIPPDGDS